MRIVHILAVFVVSASALFACGPSLESVQHGIEKHNADLRARAAFDFQCPEVSLRVTPLKTHKNVDHPEIEYVVSAGVDGCGNRGVYLYDDKRMLWVLNATSEKPKAQQ